MTEDSVSRKNAKIAKEEGEVGKRVLSGMSLACFAAWREVIEN